MVNGRKVSFFVTCVWSPPTLPSPPLPSPYPFSVLQVSPPPSPEPLLQFFPEFVWNTAEISNYKDLGENWRVPVYNGDPVDAEYDKSRNGYCMFHGGIQQAIIVQGAHPDPLEPHRALTVLELQEMVKLQASHEEGFNQFRNELITHYDLLRIQNGGKVPWLR